MSTIKNTEEGRVRSRHIIFILFRICLEKKKKEQNDKTTKEKDSDSSENKNKERTKETMKRNCSGGGVFTKK